MRRKTEAAAAEKLNRRRRRCHRCSNSTTAINWACLLKVSYDQKHPVRRKLTLQRI